MNRECNEDILINGIQFRRGDLVTMPIYAVHHSEEFYPEPEKFDPER
jgi:cytochrome P450